MNDDEFKKAGIQIRRKERTNNRGEKENYFIKLDQDGNELIRKLQVFQTVLHRLKKQLSHLLSSLTKMDLLRQSVKMISHYMLIFL